MFCSDSRQTYEAPAQTYEAPAQKPAKTTRLCYSCKATGNDIFTLRTEDIQNLFQQGKAKQVDILPLAVIRWGGWRAPGP